MVRLGKEPLLTHPPMLHDRSLGVWIELALSVQQADTQAAPLLGTTAIALRTVSGNEKEPALGTRVDRVGSEKRLQPYYSYDSQDDRGATGTGWNCLSWYCVRDATSRDKAGSADTSR